MNTLLQKIKKNCAMVLALLMGLTTTACQIPFPLTSDNSLPEASTSIESETSSDFDSEDDTDSQAPSSSDEETDDNSSTDDEQNGDSEDNDSTVDNEQGDGETDNEEDDESLQEAKRIMDEAYALATGESLPGTYTLTGTITYVYTDYTASKGICLYMDVLEPQSREMYCYQLKGVGADIISEGDTITVQGTIKNYKGTVEFDKGCTLISYTLTDGSQGTTPDNGDDPYKNMSKSEFYASYTVATSNEDAYYRSLHGFMSGELTVPDQAPTLSLYRPKVGNAYVRNTEMRYEEDGNAYVVTDVYGEEAFTVYKDGAYITLEEVAAYVYAFGTYPKNYTPSKNTSPSNSVWAEYLRVNHTQFSGSTSKYPYEPELPNITGCGGTLTYYEMDIGTTGTDCDPAYTAELYNNGYSITRGAARIVYGKRDLNGNGIFEEGEHYVFYTYNHYNDFQEYLNYQGGWGEMFGNITGGGSISSKYDYNPTDYPTVYLGALSEVTASSTSRKAITTRYFGL